MSQRTPRKTTSASAKKEEASKKGKKKSKKYKVINWREYNAALVDRGRVDVWIETDLLAQWYEKPNQGTVGSPRMYSDICIQTCLTLQHVYACKLRQTEGFVRSILVALGKGERVPDYTTLSRRSSTCKVSIQVRTTPDHVELYVDSTGGKVFGEGEWKVRKHGVGKHRTWVKVHLGITPEGDILSCVVTGNATHDSEVINELLDVGETTITAFGGDGAYDKRKVYRALIKRNITDIRIPPQKNAKIWYHGNLKSPPHPRDQNLRAIRKSTRVAWKRSCGYHVRSNAETAMFRFKTTFGDHISSRTFARQKTEVLVKVRALNVMSMLGMPKSVPM